ncbi:hypothetical protein HMPREF0666_03226 [Prevotella sp. C561]|nr:hypothetical protein HMPREF0666_03226 [Prevotella sp. C561]
MYEKKVNRQIIACSSVRIGFLFAAYARFACVIALRQVSQREPQITNGDFSRCHILTHNKPKLALLIIDLGESFAVNLFFFG